jgi:hypothetical protein
MYEYGEEKEQETDINVVQYEKKKWNKIEYTLIHKVE